MTCDINIHIFILCACVENRSLVLVLGFYHALKFTPRMKTILPLLHLSCCPRKGTPGFYHAKMCYLGLKTPQVLHGMQVLAVDRDWGRNADTEVMEIREGHNYGQDIIV